MEGQRRLVSVLPESRLVVSVRERFDGLLALYRALWRFDDQSTNTSLAVRVSGTICYRMATSTLLPSRVVSTGVALPFIQFGVPLFFGIYPVLAAKYRPTGSACDDTVPAVMQGTSSRNSPGWVCWCNCSLLVVFARVDSPRITDSRGQHPKTSECERMMHIAWVIQTAKIALYSEMLTWI